jgi:hypothetical protein
MAKIKTENIVRCEPKQTINKIRKDIKSDLITVIVSERTPNAPLTSLEDCASVRGFEAAAELSSYAELVEKANKFAAAGNECTFFYKTASFGGRARFYVFYD